jgi:hypothetical protein
MQRKALAAVTAVGVVAAIAVPALTFGNARPNPSAATNTLFVANLLGANEVPSSVPGVETQDPDGFGTATITFDLSTPGSENVCWDLAYGNLTGTPLQAHIHGPAVPGANGPVVIGFTPFSALGPTSATGCRLLTPLEAGIAADIVSNPTNYYVNVHTIDFFGGAIRGSLSTAAAPSGETHLLTEPLRAYDSRTADGPIAINTTRSVSLATGLDGTGTSRVAVPAGATGAIVTLTVTNTGTGVGGAGGFLKLFSGALTTPPSISTINWFGGDQNIAVTTQVAVDANGHVNVFAGANQTDFIIDVIGYTF